MSLKPGESVWAPRIANGVVAVAPAGTAQAITAPSRTTTYRPPAGPSPSVTDGHAAVSSRRSKPTGSSRRATSCAAWYDDGDASTNVARSCAWARARSWGVGSVTGVLGVDTGSTLRTPRSAP
ncbi:Uncharacterised protein [Mycobacteroides abscessus]|nr:Uncharacterised protein [Mycobacteroides abscessus]